MNPLPDVRARSFAVSRCAAISAMSLLVATSAGKAQSVGLEGVAAARAEQVTSEKATTPAPPGVRAGTKVWRMTLLDPSLKARPVNIVRVRSGEKLSKTKGAPGEGTESSGVQIIEADGTPRTLALSEIIAIAPLRWSEAGMDVGGTGPRSLGATTLSTVDGQRVVGSIVSLEEAGGSSGRVGSGGGTGAGPKDTALIRHDRLGLLAFPIERLAHWSREFGATSNAGGKTPTADRLRLANGDELFGVIEAFGSVINIAPEVAAGKAASDVPIEQVAEVWFANPPAPVHDGLTLWLSDGSVIAVSEVVSESDGGRLRVRPLSAFTDGEVGYILPSEIVAMSVQSSRLHPVSRLMVSNVVPESGRLYAHAPQETDGIGAPGRVTGLDAADLLLDGPMTFDIALPERARAFSTIIELPEDAWMWGDCEVSVGVAGVAMKSGQTVRLRGDQPSVPFVVDVPRGSRGPLRVTLSAGKNGAIQDRVIMRHPMIVSDK